MKKLISYLLFAGLFSFQAKAQFFPAQAHVAVNPLQVSVTVYNPYYEPIICSGQVFGQTYYGQVYNAVFLEQFMPAGTSRFAYVYTNAYNPFVNGWPQVTCRFARYW